LALLALPKKRGKLVSVRDPVKLEAIRLLAVLGEARLRVRMQAHTHAHCALALHCARALLHARRLHPALAGTSAHSPAPPPSCTLRTNAQARMSRCASRWGSPPFVGAACGCWPWTAAA
jgi:hypothetical protein